MKITIGYYEQTNGKITANSKKILEVIKGKNAKECMNQIYQKSQNHDCWKYSPINIEDVED